MRLVLRNKSKLVNAFGEEYYNDLVESINEFSYNPDSLIWNEDKKMEMLDIPSKSDPGKEYTFFVVSETWDVVILAFHSENKLSK